MCCDTKNRTAIEQARRQKALDDLIARMKAGAASLVKEGNKLVLKGWSGMERQDWTDACAVHALQHSSDFVIKQKLSQVGVVGNMVGH